eukprot:6179175-Pleurochrysis_carterae.AAC.2
MKWASSVARWAAQRVSDDRKCGWRARGAPLPFAYPASLLGDGREPRTRQSIPDQEAAWERGLWRGVPGGGGMITLCVGLSAKVEHAGFQITREGRGCLGS